MTNDEKIKMLIAESKALGNTANLVNGCTMIENAEFYVELYAQETLQDIANDLYSHSSTIFIFNKSCDVVMPQQFIERIVEI
jgi:hypothetical protein